MLNEKHIVNISEVGMTFLAYTHVLLLVMWGVILCIDNFCHGIFHGTPIAIEIFVMAIVFNTLDPSGIVPNYKTKRRQLIFLFIVLVIGFGLNVTHLVFSVIELVECTSNLCLNTFWVLAVFIGVLAAFLVLEIVEFVTGVRYYRDLGVLEGMKKN